MVSMSLQLPSGITFKVKELRGIVALGPANSLPQDQQFRPTLTLYIHKSHGDEVAIDASLSHNTRKYLRSLARLQTDRPRREDPSVDGRSNSTDGSNDMVPYV